MKKLAITLVTVVAIACGAMFGIGAHASSYEDVTVERVAKYNGSLRSLVRFENGYAVVCEPVSNGSIEVAVSGVDYSGNTAIVHLYDTNATSEDTTASNYVAYWNIYVPVSSDITDVQIAWN